MKIDLLIDTRDNQLLFDLLEEDSPKRGEPISIDENIKVEYQGTFMRNIADVPHTHHLILDIALPIATGLISTWLYDKIKERAVKLKINRTEVEISKGEITRIITETIEEQ